jgi:hypothetical protein
VIADCVRGWAERWRTPNVQKIDKAVRRKIWQVGLMRGNPHLVHHHCHHEQEIDSECPQDKKFRSLEVPPRDVVLLCPDKLIVFE